MDSEVAEKPNKRRGAIRIIGTAVLVLALLYGAWWAWNWWTVGRYMVGTNNAYIKAEAVVVAPKVRGYVEQVLVESNQMVKKGQPLAVIDPAPYQAAVDNALAEIAAAQADMVRTQSEIRRQGAVIEQSAAQARAQGSNLQLARKEARRYARLAELGADTQQQADRTAAASAAAQAESAAAVAAVETANRSRDTLRAQLEQNRAALNAARAQEKQARIDLAATTVHAPLDGLVGDKSVVAGQYAQAGTRMMTIVPITDVYLEANLKETQLERVRIGQPVRIHVDAYPATDLEGTVESRSPSTGAQFALIPPNNATGNFTKIVQRVPVRIRMSIPEDMRDLLIPGLSAEVQIDTRSLK